ncbi:MAG: trehalase family glycosidase [Pseudomonadota bacterium]
MTIDLDQRARAILAANDRGGYTVPTARLYPFQWNWDSAFCALGFATHDIDRAFREVETLIEGQWDDGMIPHIVFRRPDPDYFPGPEAWGTAGRHPRGVPTSGISQPPVLASVLRRLHQASGDAARLRPLAEACARWHAWWQRARREGGATVVVHPWESGRDNCPDWDAALDRIAIDPDLPAYTRRDTSHIDADQRPRQEQYDRYMTIVKRGADRHWETDAFAAGPFRVADPGCHFILLRAERDLAALLGALGMDDAAVRARITGLEAGADALWSEAAGAWVAHDARSDARSGAVASTAFLAWWAGAGTASQRSRALETLRAVLSSARFALPSWDPRDAAFDAPRYWRGPIWPVVNFMVSEGLREAGHADMAERIRSDTATLIREAGFMEYFDPTSGRGLGGGDFSWTAAMWLHWCGPNVPRPRQANAGEAGER